MNNQKKYNLLLLVLLLAAIFPFIALSFFNYPSADDLIFSHVAKSISIVQNISNAYFNWSGRYFSNFIITINPLVFGSEFGYKLFPIILISFMYLTLLLLIKSFLKKHFANKYLEALILLVLIILVFPSPVEALYWISGSLAYTLPYVILFSLFFLLQSPTKNKFVLIIIGLLAFLLSGTNEIMMLLSFAILLILFAFNVFTKRPSLKISMAFICSLAGMIIAISAPGNFRRLEFFPLHGQFTESVVLSAFSFLRIGIHILTQPSLWLILLVVFILASQNYFLISEHLKIKKNIIFISIISILILPALYFPAYYAMGIAPPPRLHNCISTAMLLILIFNVAVLGNYFGIVKPSVLSATPKIILQSLILIAGILLFTGIQKKPGESLKLSNNITNAWNDLLFEAAPYQKEMNERLVQINESRQSNQDTIILNPIIHKPYTIFYLDITENPEHWLNISFRDYYHLKFVKLQNKKP